MIKMLLGAVVLAAFAGTLAHAQLIPCKTFNRSSATAPQFVRDYLAHSKGPLVRACGGGDHPQYLGASSIAKEGNICRYSEYELDLSHTNPPRLEHTTAPSQTYMWVTKSACPSPEATKYAATNNVSSAVFAHLVRAWREVISSPASFDRTLSGMSDAAVIRRLRTAILQGKSSRLVVLNVATHHDFGVWKSYEMDVADPDHYDRFYAVNVSSWFGRIYAISGVSAGIY